MGSDFSTFVLRSLLVKKRGEDGAVLLGFV
jgi:hypothetical protein